MKAAALLLKEKSERWQIGRQQNLLKETAAIKKDTMATGMDGGKW